MRRPIIILVVFMSPTALAAPQEQIKVIYDLRPDADFRLEARHAGTKPDSGSSDGKFGVSSRSNPAGC